MSIKAPELDLIIFAGMMGSGKSTVAMRLAKRLNWDFIDLDGAIEVEIGSSIASYVSKFGEEPFRNLEARTLERVLIKGGPLVLALGGGTLISTQSQELIRQQESLVIWLDVDLDVILGRLMKDTEREIDRRPFLSKDDLYNSLKERLLQRRTGYQLCSHIRLECSTLSVDEIVDKALNAALKSERLAGLGSGDR